VDAHVNVVVDGSRGLMVRRTETKRARPDLVAVRVGVQVQVHVEVKVNA
jgi:hypothetical protein